MRPITARQQEVLEFIRSFIRINKYPPTIREISDNFGISVKGAHDHVRALKKKQAIRCDTNRSRAIEILDHQDARAESEPIRKVPMLGSVAAGLPLLVDENYDGTVDVPASFLRNGDYFALSVQGDSMTGAGIMDGDIAIISKTPVAENGEIVVAMVDEAVTIKRFFRESSRVQLKAENPSYAPIYTRDVRILGKLAHVIRNYE
ncbi:MAG: transcriptional repressor LexA [Spirochaetaceae bacterium]|nr:MAG: transcriptional repressor LexA [Spirochaetaceae bacterium]